MTFIPHLTKSGYIAVSLISVHHLSLRLDCASIQSDQYSMGTLWVLNGPKFLQAEN